jgi:hypothetical protein
MTRYVSDCCDAQIFYDDDDLLICASCRKECEPVKVPPDKDEIAITKAERKEGGDDSP